MEKYKAKLEEEKNLLIEELKSLGKIDTETGDWEATPEGEEFVQEVQDEADMSERAEDYEEKSMKLAALESRLNDVNHALTLIGTDEFGICEVCKIKIEEERLEANPSARTCEVCMEKVI